MLHSTGTCRAFSPCASHALRGRAPWVQGRKEGGSEAVAQAAYGSVHITRTECACYPASPAGYVSSCSVVCVVICEEQADIFVYVCIEGDMHICKSIGIRSRSLAARKPMHIYIHTERERERESARARARAREILISKSAQSLAARKPMYICMCIHGHIYMYICIYNIRMLRKILFGNADALP